ncbi:MAG: class I SAM-dependent methyltransferase, partial [Eubacteriales bacterium]|nr:class I SAM-dependent methyltransferase [Eubacteriales bacterium]
KWDGEAFIDAMQLAPEKSVLEIGVGTGRLALRVCGKCGSFTGIDISPKTVERAKTNLQNSFENLQEYKNINLICGNFLTYSFTETFDVIYSSLSFMHIKDKGAAIQKAADLLIRGGRFVLSIDKNQQTEIDYGTRKISVYPDTPDEINSLLTKVGLIIEKQFETEFAVIFTARKELS